MSDHYTRIPLPTDGEWIPAIEDHPTTFGSGLDYRDRAGVLTTDCDRGYSTKYRWDDRRREVVVYLYRNAPVKGEIDSEITKAKKEHREVSGVVIFIDPEVFAEYCPLLTALGFDRNIAREHAKVPYFVVTKTLTVKATTPDRRSVEEKLKEAKSVIPLVGPVTHDICSGSLLREKRLLPIDTLEWA